MINMKFSATTDSFYLDFQKSPDNSIEIDDDTYHNLMTEVNSDGQHEFSHDDDGSPIVIEIAVNEAQQEYIWMVEQLQITDKYCTVDAAGVDDDTQAAIIEYRAALRTYVTNNGDGTYTVNLDERPVCSVDIPY